MTQNIQETPYKRGESRYEETEKKEIIRVSSLDELNILRQKYLLARKQFEDKKNEEGYILFDTLLAEVDNRIISFKDDKNIIKQKSKKARRKIPENKNVPEGVMQDLPYGDEGKRTPFPVQPSVIQSGNVLSTSKSIDTGENTNTYLGGIKASLDCIRSPKECLDEIRNRK